MITLKDVVELWMATNKNLSRSWQLVEDGDVWTLKPIMAKHYKVNSHAIIMNDFMKLHYDDDDVIMEKGCHTKMIQAYDKEFFQKLAQWMRAVRRR